MLGTQSSPFFQLVNSHLKTNGFKGGSGGPSRGRIPFLESVKPGFEVLKLVPAKMATAGLQIVPSTIPEPGHVFGPAIPGSAGLRIEVIGKHHHASMSALEGPDCLVKVPDALAQVYAIQVREGFTCDISEKTRFGQAGGAGPVRCV